jgi:hypothetical protein
MMRVAYVKNFKEASHATILVFGNPRPSLTFHGAVIHVFRDLIDMPATVEITSSEVRVHFHRRAHLPIVMASGLLNTAVAVPWWSRTTLRLTA